MKIINDYLDSLYGDNLNENAIELREELNEHLLILVDEFTEKGFSLTEAQHMAIEQFDGGSDMAKELRSMYRKNINVKNYRLEKITSVRRVIFNIWGWIMCATIYTAFRSVGDVVPPWLLVSFIMLTATLIILSIVILLFKRK